MKKLMIFGILFCLSTAISFAQLKLTSPNGGDKFVVGSDTLITWEGISPSDSVQIDYSLDGGKNWLLFSKKTIGLNYLWKNIPNKVGVGYLLRLIHKGETITKLDEPYIEWQKTYGGTDSDHLISIKELEEGGYIAVGNSWSKDGDLDSNKGNLDLWLLKVDKLGNKVFSKTYGGSKEEMATFVLETKDSGFLVGGRTMSEDFGNVTIQEQNGHYGGTSQILIKLDSEGNLMWRKNYGNDRIGSFNSALETNDGSYIVIGDTCYQNSYDGSSPNENHLWILKIDVDGNYQWSLTNDNSNGNIAESIENTIDGGYIISYYSRNSRNINTADHGIYVIKLDKNGTLEWQNNYISNSAEFSGHIKQTKDGDYYLLSSSSANEYNSSFYKGGPYDVILIKLNGKGDVLWSKNYGGSGWDVSSSLNSSADSFIGNNLIFCASSNSNDGDLNNNKGNEDGWFVKLDYEGRILYQGNYGGSNRDYFYSTQQTFDSGYVICGRTGSNDGDVTENKGGDDGWIIKLGVKYQTIDTATTTFSIVAPQPAALDVDMGKVYVGEWRDSTVAEFVYNIGSYKFRVDSVYIRGGDKSAFSLIGGFPKYNVEPDSGREAMFKFTPSRVGMHYAEIVIITQAKILVQKIIGEGLQKKARIQAELEPFANLICENSTTSTLKIKSTGNDNLIVKELNITGKDKADFALNQTLPFTLKPDSSKIITIGFKSKVPGIKTAALEIKSNSETNPVLTIPLIARKDSIALVPNPALIDLGVLFPNQTKDTSYIISNLGTIKTDGKVTFTGNIACANPTFTIDSGATHQFDFTFTGLPTDGNINEKITVWDEVCKYYRDVLITGKVVSPNLQGFSAVQCKSYENEYKLSLNNPTSNKLNITSIVFDTNPNLFQIDPSLAFPIVIAPLTDNYEVKVKYKDNTAQKFKTAVNFITDNKFIPVLTDTIFAETVDYIRTTSGLIDGEIHDISNPFEVSYAQNSENGKDKFTYSIKVNENADEMDYLTELSNLEVIINYNSNVIGADFDSQTGKLQVRLGTDLQNDYSIQSTKETKIDELNSQIVVGLENTGKPITKKDAYELLEIDFSAFLGKENLSNEQNSPKSRNAIISHIINSSDECISYETAENAYLDIEKLCVDDFRSIKIPSDTTAKFYLGKVIPNPIGTDGATIEYGLGFECEVIITIYDISGAVVLVPIDETQKAGTHKLGISRKSLSAGAYFIEMKAGQFKATKKVIVE